MQTINRINRVLTSVGIAMCVFITIPVHADPAPVFDADTLQQDENIGVYASTQPDNLPPAPPEAETAFVPSSVSPSAQGISLEQRIRRIEQQINNMLNTDVATRVDSLQNQIQALRGQIEQLTHQLQQAQSQQKTLAAAFERLDKRLSADPRGNPSTQAALPVQDEIVNVAHSNTAAIASLPADKSFRKRPSGSDKLASKNSQPNMAEEQEIYQTAYNLIKAKRYDAAVSALQGMLKKYPSGQFAANAHYWLGELYGLMGQNDQAVAEFAAVVKTYPDSPRISDAQLKLGLIYASQTKWGEAKMAFKKVISQFPGTASARLASEQLRQLKQAGH